MRLIDADALINDVDGDLLDGIAEARAIEKIENAPTIGGWISVKERLPEEHADEHPYEFEQFLCSTVWDDVRMVGFGTRIGDDKPHFWSGNSIWDDWVTHWMPIPEPPKGDYNG
jgi:hypothetical protein